MTHHLVFEGADFFLPCVTLCGAIADAEISTSSPSVVTAGAHFLERGDACEKAPEKATPGLG